MLAHLSAAGCEERKWIFPRKLNGVTDEQLISIYQEKSKIEVKTEPIAQKWTEKCSFSSWECGFNGHIIFLSPRRFAKQNFQTLQGKLIHENEESSF